MQHTNFSYNIYKAWVYTVLRNEPMPLDVYEALIGEKIVPEKLVSMFLVGMEPPLTEHELLHCTEDLSTGIHLKSGAEEVEETKGNLIQLFNNNNNNKRR